MMLFLMLLMMLRFCVKESSSRIVLEILGLQGFSLQPVWISAPPISQKVIKSLPTPTPFSTKFLHSPNFNIIITRSWRLKNKNQKMAIEIFNNRISRFSQGIFLKFSDCGVDFFQEPVIHDHEGLLQAEKFQYPTNILEIPTVTASFC